jgi:hypothetical protein
MQSLNPPAERDQAVLDAEDEFADAPFGFEAAALFVRRQHAVSNGARGRRFPRPASSPPDTGVRYAAP